jgi:GntR family transcriptional regulator / MocR family aminotransferase
MRSAAAGCRAASGCRRRGQLARELGVSRGLVQECYNQLLAEGYLTSQVGSATRVAAAARRAIGGAGSAASADRRLPGRRAGPGELPARRLGVGDPGGLPQRCHAGPRLRRPARQRPAAPGPRRLPAALRAAAADHDRIVVCTGFAQGLNLVLRALTQLGVRRAALEDPGHGDLAASESAQAARAAGIDVVRVPVDELGLNVAALEASGARPSW